MFTILGKSVSKRPLAYVIVWCLLLVVTGSCALSGFGQGNIFSRLESSSSLVPGSESDVVAQKQAVSHAGETVTAIVTGVELSQGKGSLPDLRNRLEEISHVDSVLDPQKIDAEFIDAIEKERVKALDEALKEAEPKIQAAVEQALAAQAASLAYLPEPARSQAEAQIASQVREEATTQVKSEASTRIDAELGKLENPAISFTPDGDRVGAGGFAVVVQMKPGEHQSAHDRVMFVFSEYQRQLQADGNSQAKVQLMSRELIQSVILDQVASDLVRGETVGLPIALLLMILVFGGVLAAGLPLGAAIVSIAIAMGIIWGVTFITNVDSFVLNILSIIGLALSIDYGLLVVSRYREIIHAEFTQRNLRRREAKSQIEELKPIITKAVTNTVMTAGRTVTFSAITIAVSIAGLFMIKAPMIQMIAVGGVVVTLFAVFTAVTFVPAMITLLGYRLIQPSPLSRLPGFSFLFQHVGDASAKRGVFSKLAVWVHRRPWRVLIIITALLVVMALPIKGLQMRSNFIEYVPEGSPVSQAMDEIDAKFPAFQTPDIAIFAQAKPTEVKDFVADLEKLDGVKRVGEPTEKDDGAMISVFTDAKDSVGKEVTQLVEDLRERELGYPIHVGGAAAMQLDFVNALYTGAPYAAIVIVLAVLLLLFLLTGSVVAPLKALVINTLSLVASMGITVFIFNHGLFGMPVSEGLETFVVACAAAFGFGLAMDYEVFLIARIKEYWDAGMSSDESVEHGLQQSGRIITAAAAIIIAVFIGFSFGGLLPIKQIGVALAVIVFVDATLVRMLLVPALMTLLGKWNWWAPKPLMKFYEKFKIVH